MKTYTLVDSISNKFVLFEFGTVSLSENKCMVFIERREAADVRDKVLLLTLDDERAVHPVIMTNFIK